MSLHLEVHVSLCLLYGIWPSERTGNKCFKLAFCGQTRKKCFNYDLIFPQFEYQQAQLEAEIENLSWKIERAETTDRGDLQNQMDIAEKRRSILLKDFLEV